MSVATWTFIAIVVSPLVLLVVDLVAHKAPEPLAPPARAGRSQ